MPSYKYRAFISYSHADRAWGDWLHKALETYPIPARLVGRVTAAGPIPKSLAPIFRDRDELPSANDLSRKVSEALAQSANLIVICSPRSASSRWVNEEVLGFKRLGRVDRVFCVIVDGEPNAASPAIGDAGQECFAPALRFQLGDDGELSGIPTEPIAADARAGKDGKANAKLKLISGLLDIGFDELRQRELQRRNRRLAAVTALALVVMAVTTALAISAVIARNSAVVARQAAERRQKQAERLVGFMLGDLNDKLAQVQRLDIMEAVDSQAMRYFQSLPTTDVTDEALAQRAKALEKIGSVRFDQGHLPAAMQAYQSSLKFVSALASSAPKDTQRQMALARIWAFVGMTHWQQGQLDQAQKSFEAAQAILRRAHAQVAAGPSLQNPGLTFDLASLDNNIGHVLEARGRFDEAALQYRNMLAASQRLAAAQPDNTTWAVQLGLAHNNLGKLALASGDLEGAVLRYAADDAIESRLSARDPRNNEQREKMAIARATLGRTLALAGEVDTGMGHLREAVGAASELADVDPANAGVAEDHALYAGQLARLMRLSGDLTAASALTTQAVSIFRRLAQQDPGNSSWHRELAEAQLEQAALSRASGHADTARTFAKAALAVLGPLHQQQPDDPATSLALVATKLQLADLALPGDVPNAGQLRGDALAMLQQRNRGDPRWLALQCEALLRLGRRTELQPVIARLWAMGYRDPALLALLRGAGIDYPVNPSLQARLRAATPPTASATGSV